MRLEDLLLTLSPAERADLFALMDQRPGKTEGGGIEQPRSYMPFTPSQRPEFKVAKVKAPPKMHWSGSTFCSLVMGPHAWCNTYRIVEGDKFNELPKEDRCINCDQQFMRA